MKNFKRVLATLLMLVMLMQPFATAASVTEFLDFPNNWSTEAMTAAVENGLLIGNGNKLIEPNRNLRRSELAAIITRAFGATITADIGHFDDVKPGDWYYNAVSEALQMGAMSGTSSSTFHPDKSVTREEVFTTLARVLCLEGTDASVLDRFSDKGEISDWALASVIGLVENGYIDGYPDGTLDPRGDMTRAELAQMFHNLFKTYIDTAGYHTYVKSEGSVIVRAPGAHLENVTINGDLIIADGVGAGDFDLNSVTVNGRILARGGEGKVTFKKVTAAENVVIFDRNGVVNFNNYRTDVPFKDNLVEHTPATFLTKKPVNTGTGSSRPSGGDHTTRYNVYFYFDGRIFDSVSVKEGNPVSAPTRTPAKEGYTFVYWSDNKDDDGTGEGFDFTTPITGSTRLYAIFTRDAVEYEITFDFGNGTTKIVTIGEGEKVDEADVPVMPDTDTQYFKGWKTPDGTNIPTESVKDFAFNEDTVLTPWFVDKDKKIITFYDGDQPFTTVEVPEGGKAEEPDDKPEKEGAEFKYWGTAPGAEEPFDFENEEITDDTKLYAVYEYTVKFDGDLYPEQKLIHGKTVANPGAAPEVEGKTFEYWSTSADGEEYNFATPVTESFTLYAVYITNKYEITIDGGAPFEVEHGSTIPAEKIPAKEDTETQYFKGWTVTYDDGSAPENIPADEFDEYEVTKPATITPWYVDKDKKVVTFYNGSATHDTQEIPEGGKATKPATDPEKDGAEFKYWGTSEDAEEAFDFENTPITEETKLYAVYEYTVSFSGTSFADQKIIHGKTVTNPGEATEEGKIFKHWSLTVDGDAYDFNTKVTESFKLYPVFTDALVTKYTVTFIVEGNPVSSEDVDEGNTVTKPANPAAPAGMKFSHWSITPDGAEYDFTTPVNSEFDLYAVFVPVTAEKFDVVFKVDGTEVHSEEVTDGGYATGPATDPEDTDEKYFAGWIVEGDTTETVVDLATYAITEDTVFVALYKNKLVVAFYDLSLDEDPLYTTYVVPGETLAENQYPHHEDNLGDYIFDLGEMYEGFEKNSGIHSVYDGVDYVHTVPMSYWYLANEADTVWTAFDSNVVITEDTDVHLNVQEVTVTIDIPKLSATFALPLWAPYSKSTRVIDTVKDALFISEETILRGIGTVEDDIMGKLVERDILDEDYNIKNIHKHITLVQILGEERIETMIWDVAGDVIEENEDIEDWIKNNFVSKYQSLSEEERQKLIHTFGDIFDTVMETEDISDELKADIVDIVNDFFMTMSEESIDDLINHYLCNRINDGDKEHVKELITSMLKNFNEHDNSGKLESVIVDFVFEQIQTNDELRALVIAHVKEDIVNDTTGKYDELLTGYIKSMVDYENNENAAENEENIKAIIKSVVENNFDLLEASIADKIENDDDFARNILYTALDSDDDGTLTNTIKNNIRPLILDAIKDEDEYKAELENAVNTAIDYAFDYAVPLAVDKAIEKMKEQAITVAVDEFIKNIEEYAMEKAVEKAIDDAASEIAPFELTDEQKLEIEAEVRANADIISDIHAAVDNDANRKALSEAVEEAVYNGNANDVVVEFNGEEYTIKAISIKEAADKINSLVDNAENRKTISDAINNVLGGNAATNITIVIEGNDYVINAADIDTWVNELKSTIDTKDNRDTIRNAIEKAINGEDFELDINIDGIDAEDLAEIKAEIQEKAKEVNNYIDEKLEEELSGMTSVELKQNIEKYWNTVKDTATSEAISLIESDKDVRNAAIDAYIKAIGVAGLAETLVDAILDNPELFDDPEINKILDSAVKDQIDILEKDDPMIVGYVDDLIANENFEVFADAFVSIEVEETRHEIVNKIVHELLFLSGDDNASEDREVMKPIIEELVDEMFEMGHIDEEFIEYFLEHMGDEENTEALHDFVEFVKDLDPAMLSRIAAALGQDQSNKQVAYVDQIIDELCTGSDVTVTADRRFMFDPIVEKLEEFNYEFVESKIPAQLKNVLPMEHIEELFTRFYDDAKYGYVSQLKDAMAKAEADPEGTYYVGSGVTIMINPISDLFAPALEYALEMKGLAEGKLASKFPVYYSYYKNNPYANALEDYLTTEIWFDGSDAGFEDELSGYSLKSFDEYYQIVKALTVLADDAVLYYYNEVPEADRDKVLEVALTKLLDIANIVNGVLVDYAVNGIPENLEDFIKSIEKDPELLEYLEKFGVDAYLDKIAGNANADKVYDTAFDKLMGKFGDRVEALLTKFAESKLNRYYDEGEYNKALEVVNALFTTEEGEAIYTVDTIFEEFLDGVFFKEISAKGATVSVERDFLTNVDDAK